MKLTLGDVRAGIAKVLSLPEDDIRVIRFINEAQQRLAYKGKWQGTLAKYVVTQSAGLITWPRQLETIESAAIDSNPAVVRNRWYEFVESGPGLVDASGADASTLIDRGEAVTFSDIETTGNPKKLKFYSTAGTDDGGLEILVQGYDWDGNWVRNKVSNTWMDGEVLTLPAAGGSGYVLSTSNYSAITGIQKTVTGGNIKLEELDTVTSVVREIGEYEPTEVRPVYRRSMVPGLSDSQAKTVTVIGKMRFIPAVVDSDWLYISYEAALKLMVQAVDKEEKNLIEESFAYEAKALGLMQDQLSHHLGDGAVAVPRVQGGEVFAGGGVPNLQ
jgi:hypothetical protein